MTKEDVVLGMKHDPEIWAELYLEQQLLIKTLTQINEDFKSRLKLLLLDPDQARPH